MGGVILSLILHKIRSGGDLVVEFAGGVVVGGHPIDDWGAIRVGGVIDRLDERFASAGAACRRVYEQVLQIDDVLGVPAVTVLEEVDQTDGRFALDGEMASWFICVVTEKAGEGRVIDRMRHRGFVVI